MSDDLLGIVNASGFAFQLAVEEAILASGAARKHEWNVTSREHGWNDGGIPRFIDLVLTKGQLHLPVECKRPRGADWIFLVADRPQGRTAKPHQRFRTHYLRNQESAEGRIATGGLADFHQEHPSWESSFCTVRGSSEKDSPMLDRLCAELTRSSDALAGQQLDVDGGRNSHGHIELRSGAWIVAPVIVTTAKSHVCRFDPAVVPLATGLVPEGAAKWSEVPRVVYRKNFDAPSALEREFASVGALERDAQRSVTIVTATHLLEWLRGFELSR
jgi:hypothetical protein